MENTLISNVTNSMGRTTRIEDVKFPDGSKARYTYCTYEKGHPMREKLGVTKSYIGKHNGDHKFYSLEGDVFGRRFEFKTDLFNKAKSPLEQIKEFAEGLLKAQKYKPTKYLERIANIAKYIKV